jgi:hypothetical protein
MIDRSSPCKVEIEMGTSWMSSSTFREVTVISPTATGNGSASFSATGCCSGASWASTGPLHIAKKAAITHSPNRMLLIGFSMNDLPFKNGLMCDIFRRRG